MYGDEGNDPLPRQNGDVSSHAPIMVGRVLWVNKLK